MRILERTSTKHDRPWRSWRRARNRRTRWCWVRNIVGGRAYHSYHTLFSKITRTHTQVRWNASRKVCSETRQSVEKSRSRVTHFSAFTWFMTRSEENPGRRTWFVVVRFDSTTCGTISSPYVRSNSSPRICPRRRRLVIVRFKFECEAREFLFFMFVSLVSLENQYILEHQHSNTRYDRTHNRGISRIPGADLYSASEFKIGRS